MFSQYNYEKQAEARQRDIARSAQPKLRLNSWPRLSLPAAKSFRRDLLLLLLIAPFLLAALWLLL